MEYENMNAQQKLEHLLENAQKMEDLGDLEMAEKMRAQARMIFELNSALERGEKIYRVGPQDRATRRALFLQYGMKMGH